jgi:hypothetical protein
MQEGFVDTLAYILLLIYIGIADPDASELFSVEPEFYKHN